MEGNSDGVSFILSVELCSYIITIGFYGAKAYTKMKSDLFFSKALCVVSEDLLLSG